MENVRVPTTTDEQIERQGTACTCSTPNLGRLLEIVLLLCDEENQPHQYVGEQDKLFHALLLMLMPKIVLIER